MSVYRPYNPKSWDDRKNVIQIIEDLRYGNSFEHFKQKFFDPNRDRTRDGVSDENKKRLYVTKGAVDEVISKLVAFCPILEAETNVSDKKATYIKKILQNIKWQTLNTTIYDILESKGDCFLYYYFDEKNTEEGTQYMPYITVIPTEEVSDIVLDKFNRPVAYIWKTKQADVTFNIESKKVEKENEKDVVIVFEKGQVTMIDDSSVLKGHALVNDKHNNIKVLKTTISPEVIGDLFSIIHIKSNEVSNCPFSRIPADKYIDDSLRLDQIESDIRGSNRIIGFPKMFLIDGEIVDGSTNIGGFASVKSDRELLEDDREEDDIITTYGLNNNFKYPQAQIKDIQINNDLRSMFNERNDVYDSLHEKAGLTPPSLNIHLSKSDSSKVYQQINRRMEQKIQIYIQNIIEGFKPFFESVLKLADMYDDTDIDYSFKMPTSVLRDSAYDVALTNSIKLKSGEETIQTLLAKKGLSQEEIENHIKALNEELMLGTDDISIGLAQNTPTVEK